MKRGLLHAGFAALMTIGGLTIFPALISAEDLGEPLRCPYLEAIHSGVCPYLREQSTDEDGNPVCPFGDEGEEDDAPVSDVHVL